MNLNATLFGQMITFLLFVWFTMKFVWPIIIGKMDERQQRIADGLAAAEKSQRELELAQKNIAEQLKDAKLKSAEIVEQATHRANQIVEASKEDARREGLRLKEMAEAEIAQSLEHARLALRQEVARLAVTGAQKIIAKEIDAASHKQLIDGLIEQL